MNMRVNQAQSGDHKRFGGVADQLHNVRVLGGGQRIHFLDKFGKLCFGELLHQQFLERDRSATIPSFEHAAKRAFAQQAVVTDARDLVACNVI